MTITPEGKAAHGLEGFGFTRSGQSAWFGDWRHPLRDIDGESVTIAATTTGDAAEVSALLAELGYPIGIDDAAHQLERLAATGNDPVFLFRREGRGARLLSRARL